MPTREGSVIQMSNSNEMASFAKLLYCFYTSQKKKKKKKWSKAKTVPWVCVITWFHSSCFKNGQTTLKEFLFLQFERRPSLARLLEQMLFHFINCIAHTTSAHVQRDMHHIYMPYTSPATLSFLTFVKAQGRSKELAEFMPVIAVFMPWTLVSVLLCIIIYPK